MFKIICDEDDSRRNQFAVIDKGGKNKAAPQIVQDDTNSVVLNNSVLMTLIHELANRLFTVCAIHMEKPYIQYQKGSEFSRVLASILHEQFEDFYQGDNQRLIKEPRGSLLILDRTFDLISPIAHDFFYQTNVLDIKDLVNPDGSVKVENKTVYLNDQDELWVKLRNMHFLESFNYVNEQVQSIVDTSKTDTSQMALKDMAEMMRKLPKQQEMMRGFKIHVDLLNKVTTNLQQNQIAKIVDLE